MPYIFFDPKLIAELLLRGYKVFLDSWESPQEQFNKEKAVRKCVEELEASGHWFEKFLVKEKAIGDVENV